jgi:hypothetical protein
LWPGLGRWPVAAGGEKGRGSYGRPRRGGGGGCREGREAGVALVM